MSFIKAAQKYRQNAVLIKFAKVVEKNTQIRPLNSSSLKALEKQYWLGIQRNLMLKKYTAAFDMLKQSTAIVGTNSLENMTALYFLLYNPSLYPKYFANIYKKLPKRVSGNLDWTSGQIDKFLVKISHESELSDEELNRILQICVHIDCDKAIISYVFSKMQELTRMCFEKCVESGTPISMSLMHKLQINGFGSLLKAYGVNVPMNLKSERETRRTLNFLSYSGRRSRLNNY
ncbi:hypothetical protein ROZALSC1DRAFT_29313, partial [Rozella allomycis CSF55]